MEENETVGTTSFAQKQDKGIRRPGTEHRLETEKGGGAKIYFFIIAILALLATNVYFYIQYKQSNEKKEILLNEKIQMETELDRIEGELDRVSKDNVELTEKLKYTQENARVKIEVLRAQLTQQKMDRQELLSAQHEISQLKKMVAQYTKEIDRLRSENALLLSERDSLQRSVNTVYKKAEVLENVNSDLEKKVSIASVLKLSSININAIDEKRNGKETVETKAKRTNKFKIDFAVADNPIAKKAIYDVYLRVIEPNGNLLITGNNIFEIDGVEMQYTEKEGIEFLNDGKLYSIEWGGVDKFKPGTYTIVLYTNKGTMGKGTIVLN